MKRVILILTSVICFALGSASLPAALTNYWDGNGDALGAGAAPNGNWDPADPVNGPFFWTADSTGASPTNAWPDGGVAVFSAGTDAIDAYTVTIAGFPQAAGLIFEEGVPTLTGGGIFMTNEFEFPIICQTNATIASDLVDSSTTCGWKKTGPGKLNLSGASSSYGNGDGSTTGGTNIIAEGVVAITAISVNAPWLGGINSGASPTIVSNGAALEQGAPLTALPEVIHLSGTGVTNSGAFYATSVAGGNNGPSAPIILDSTALLSVYAGGQWNFKSPCGFISSSATVTASGTTGGSYDLIFGGNGGTLRLNNTATVAPYPNARVCFLGDGKIIKNGTMQLRLETAGLFNGGFYFNEGRVTVRYPMFGQGPGGVGLGTVYVAAGAQEFNNASTTVAIGNSIVLAAGANPRFSVSAAANTITCSGVISGAGGLSVTNLGKLIISGASTYSGNTTILGNAAPAFGAGTLALTGGGSIANSPVIDVQQNATFDVSGIAAPPFVLGAAQTLMGNGNVIGNVTANGTLSPGASIGQLTFANDLTVAGGLIIEVDKTATPANDSIAVTGALTGVAGGAVMVKTNGAAALVAGDNFTISPLMVNGQALAVFGGGVVWTNELTLSGKITVIAAAPVTASNLKVTAIGLNSVTLGATGGAYQGYGVLAATSITTPMSSWTLIGGATADGSGNITFTDTQATQQQKYYRLVQ